MVTMGALLGGGPNKVEMVPLPLPAEDEKRVEDLIVELGRLMNIIAHMQSALYVRFQNTKLDSLEEMKAHRTHWREVIVRRLASFSYISHHSQISFSTCLVRRLGSQS